MSSTLKDRLFLLLNARKDHLLGIICLLITVVILITGLWPLNFDPVNKVEWLQNGKGIRFYGRGIVFSPEPLVTDGAASRNAYITVEFLIRPHRKSSYAVASILTLYDRDLERFILGQWKKELIIRIPAAKADRQEHFREIGIDDALKRDTTHLITVTFGKESTDIYLDGEFEKSVPHYALISDDQGFSGQLILGNSPEGTHPWNGTFFGLAIYDRPLNSKEALDHYQVWQQRIPSRSRLLSGSSMPIALYLFDEHGGGQIRNHSGDRNHLLIPSTFKPLHRTILGVPAKSQWFTRWILMDITINILGFIPFGFFLTAWLWQAKNLSVLRAYGTSILLGVSISIAIELIQAYLPTRDSSFLDVISNTLGTVIGVLLLQYALPILHRIKGDRTLTS